jgi:predicted AlkP superfamily pyrophosphatase or phosphodiesterase
MFPTAVINVVGLTKNLLGPDTPHLNALAADGSMAPVRAITPAVTCSAQATFLTGLMPREHGIVGNGWYFRDLAQVMFWKQANQLVAGEKVWETARRRDPSCTTAKMFWWYNMYSSAEWSVTPRPIYRADGLKIVDIYSQPGGIRDRLVAEHGAFPFFNFWGPQAGIRSSEWIAEASISVDKWYSPTLLLVYLPHLDYNLQRLGPDDPSIRNDVRAIDGVCGRLIAHCRERGRRVIALSEYGLVPVAGPVHINRVLRDAGLLAIRDELGSDTLDAGASEAFAVADHQVAHVYVRNPARIGARSPPTARFRARPRSVRRAGRDFRTRPLVHVLLLAGRQQGARLRAHGRHSSQAGLRPGGIVCRSGPDRPQAHRRRDAGQKGARLPLPDERDSPGCVPGQGLSRTRDGIARRWAAADLVGA